MGDPYVKPTRMRLELKDSECDYDYWCRRTTNILLVQWTSADLIFVVERHGEDKRVGVSMWMDYGHMEEKEGFFLLRFDDVAFLVKIDEEILQTLFDAEFT